MCQFRQTFFGDNYIFFQAPSEYSQVVYEKLYLMKVHMGWSFEEAYMLPIPLREWFINKWVEQNTKSSE